MSEPSEPSSEDVPDSQDDQESVKPNRNPGGQLRFVALVVVLLNIAFVGGLMLSGERSCSEAWDMLSDDGAMASTRFNFSDQAETLNVIFISMDALRWDRTGLSGNGNNLTPNIDRFAESAVVFHNATSAAPWTLPSHMAVWTGRWPSVHEVTNKLEPTAGGTMIDSSLSRGITTYPDLLIQSGREPLIWHVDCRETLIWHVDCREPLIWHADCRKTPNTAC